MDQSGATYAHSTRRHSTRLDSHEYSAVRAVSFGMGWGENGTGSDAMRCDGIRAEQIDGAKSVLYCTVRYCTAFD